MNIHTLRPLAVPSNGRTRVLFIIAVSLALTLVAGLVIFRNTASAFTEEAKLAFSVKSSEYDTVLIQQDRSVRSFGLNGIALDLDSDEPFVPGSTARVILQVGNNSAAGEASLTPFPEVAGELSEHLRMSALATRGDGSEVVLFGDPANPASGVVPGSELPDTAVQLAARGGTALKDGDTWDGPEESSATVTYFIHLNDDAELKQMSKASFSLGLQLDSQST
ncbi:hypothetical protein GCM10009786_06130 [Leucobacter alluvii]|uniref:SAF domain-containing protein n=1 Tax=Leucobacter alluvii TaxID=340321 RepID=A0ABN3B408_9MICO